MIRNFLKVLLLIFVGALLIIFIITFLGPPACVLCSKSISKKTGYFISFKKAACCPHCGLTYQIKSKAKIKSAKATDFEDQKYVNSKSAYYLVGSGLLPCCAPKVLIGEYKTCYYKTYDSSKCCSPSIVAFEDKEKALKYQRDYGGKVASYDEIFELVKKEVE